jgi:hypothetical protein
MFCPPKRQFLFDILTQTVLQQSSFLEGDATNYIYVFLRLGCTNRPNESKLIQDNFTKLVLEDSLLTKVFSS